MSMSLAKASEPSMPELDHSTPRRPSRAPSRLSLANSTSSRDDRQGPLGDGSFHSGRASSANLRIASLTGGSTDSDTTPKKRTPLPTPPQSETMSNGSSSQARLDLLPSLELSADEADDEVLEGRASSKGLRDAGLNSSRRNRYAEIERREAPQRSASALLRRQSSSATITHKDDRDRENRTREPTSARTEGRSTGQDKGRDREERRKTSAMHERELSQMRSESRLGGRSVDEAEEEEEERSPRKSISSNGPHVVGGSREGENGGGESTEDTSGTEGTGPVFERRRRKKSSTSSSSKTHAKQNLHTSPIKGGGNGSGSGGGSGRARDRYEDWERTGSVRARNDQDERRISLSPQLERNLGNTSGNGGARSGRVPFSTTTKRSGLPLEFQSDRHTMPSRYRSDAISDEYDVDGRSHVRHFPASDATSDEVWPRGEEASSARFRPSGGSSTHSVRRRRHASDAQASDVVAADEYEREQERERVSAAFSRNGRISVDASSVSKYLSRTVPRPSGGTGRSSRDWDLEVSSPSEAIRQRKISTSSSMSQRSSGGASDVHRSASRSSLRRAYGGKDVFDDENPPPLPALGPMVTSREQDRKERLNALRERQEKLKNNPLGSTQWWDELDDLRARIDELSMDSHPSRSQSQSRASSRASAVSSTRSRSRVGETPSHTLRRTRPMTEPRKGHSSNHDRSMSEHVFAPPVPLPSQSAGKEESRSRSGTLNESGRRYASATYDNRRPPVTPDVHSASATIGRSGGSRLAHTGPMTSTSRFPSLNGEKGEQGENLPLHERNLLNAFDVFDRHFSQSGQAGTPNSSSTSMRGGPESIELVDKFRAISDSSMRINDGLRRLVQMTLEAQIDAEIATNGASSSTSTSTTAFRALDKGLTSILRDSDEQVRNLTDGLMIFTRAERERERMRRVLSTSDQGSVGGRPGSRVSLLASPETERGSPGNNEVENKSATDVRRAFLQRERVGAATLSVAGQSSASSTSQGSSEVSGGSQRRMGAEATSPYSPSPYPSRGKEGIKSPTLSTAARASSQRLRSTLGMSHKRSSSELLSTKSPPVEIRKEKVSANQSSNSVSKPPASLSPRRPKLSFPRVSTENALARNAVDIVDAAAANEAAGDSSFASSLDDSLPYTIIDDGASKARGAFDEPREQTRSRLAWNMFERPMTTEPEPQSAGSLQPSVLPRRSMTLRNQDNRLPSQRASLDVSSSPRQLGASAGVAPRQSLEPTAHMSSQPGGGVGLNAASRMIRSLGRGAGRRLSVQFDAEREGLSSSSGISPND